MRKKLSKLLYILLVCWSIWFIYISVFGERAAEPDQLPSPISAVEDFKDCVEAGNPVMESYPRQCRHNGELFIEEIDEAVVPNPMAGEVTTCDSDNRPEACTLEYMPVCGLVQVECITAPCDPVPQTFGNGCSACGNERVLSYTLGECNSENNES